MYITIQPEFISRIEELRQRLHNLSQSHTLTISYYHHQVLDESIALYKQGFRFMPVVGATAVVEACLMSESRRKKKHDTLKERFEHRVRLYQLIKGADPSKIPIAELLDEDETLESIIKGESTKFARLRNKFAHGDVLEIVTWSMGFYRYLPPKDELKRKYGVELPDNSVRMDLPGYVQLIKCLNFLLQWRENLRLGTR